MLATLTSRSDRHLISPDFKRLEMVRTEGRRQRSIGRISSPSHKHPSGPRLIVACVKDMPLPSEVHFKPRAEIHRKRDWGHANVPQVSSRVARRDIEATTKSNCEVCKVPANSCGFSKGVERAAIRSGSLIVELDVLMDEITNRLHPRPTFFDRSKAFPGKVAQLAIDFAIAAAEKELERLVGQILNRMLWGVWKLRVRQAIISNDGIILEYDSPGWRKSFRAAIPE